MSQLLLLLFQTLFSKSEKFNVLNTLSLSALGEKVNLLTSLSLHVSVSPSVHLSWQTDITRQTDRDVTPAGSLSLAACQTPNGNQTARLSVSFSHTLLPFCSPHPAHSLTSPTLTQTCLSPTLALFHTFCLPHFSPSVYLQSPSSPLSISKAALK